MDCVVHVSFTIYFFPTQLLTFVLIHLLVSEMTQKRPPSQPNTCTRSASRTGTERESCSTPRFFFTYSGRSPNPGLDYRRAPWKLVTDWKDTGYLKRTAGPPTQERRKQPTRFRW